MDQGGNSSGDVTGDQLKLMKHDDSITEKLENSNERCEMHQMVLNNVYELLECPVCMTVMSRPIYQCPNGHTICSNCKMQVHSCCPICRIDMGSIRCLALEKVVEPLEIPYDCPYADSECSITGNIPELVMHLKDDHNVETRDGFSFMHSYVQSLSQEMEKAKGMICVFKCYGQPFCYHFESFLVGTTPCYIAFLRFMGEHNEAKVFKYLLSIDRDGRQLTWKGSPRSIRDHYQQVRDSLDGLVIPQNLALLFSDKNEQELKLQLQIRICTKQ